MKKIYLLLLLGAVTLIITNSLHAQNWLLNGNSGISTTNFLGTKDGRDLVFKANNAEGARLFYTGTWRFSGPVRIIKTSQSELLRLQSASPYIGFYDSTGKYQGFVWKNTTNDMILGTSCTNTTGRIVLQLNCADNYIFTRTGSFTIKGSVPQIYFNQNGVTSGNIYGSGKNLFINGATTGNPGAAGNLILQTGTTGPFGNSFAGNVGIGTTNPTHKLSVAGTIRSQEILVEITGWADYVFEKDYKLRSLDDVATYIKQNKHLPGILSAKEIQENGLAVGETQARMMEKIEELTLYLIEQNTLILKLQEKIEQVEKAKGR